MVPGIISWEWKKPGYSELVSPDAFGEEAPETANTYTHRSPRLGDEKPRFPWFWCSEIRSKPSLHSAIWLLRTLACVHAPCMLNSINI